MVSKSHSKVSVVKQCRYLGINRSSIYTQKKGESSLNLELMEKMDVHHLKHPYKGCPRMYDYLTLDEGYGISYNRVERLYYKVMGLKAIIPGPHTSKRRKEHKVYPYLLRDMQITAPNQVWATDITYIGLARGYMYLTAIIDVYSRYIVGWSLSNTMTSEWCARVLEEAIDSYGVPTILNTDQGAQYTSEKFVQAVKGASIQLSMDGKGRATDNAYIERFWRSMKYEKIHLYKPEDGIEAFTLICEYMDYYNNRRRHSSLEKHVPSAIYPRPHLPHSNTLDNKAQKVELLSNSEH